MFCDPLEARRGARGRRGRPIVSDTSGRHHSQLAPASCSFVCPTPISDGPKQLALGGDLLTCRMVFPTSPIPMHPSAAIDPMAFGLPSLHLAIQHLLLVHHLGSGLQVSRQRHVRQPKRHSSHARREQSSGLAGRVLESWRRSRGRPSFRPVGPVGAQFCPRRDDGAGGQNVQP
jgi:hypothetical protein